MFSGFSDWWYGKKTLSEAPDTSASETPVNSSTSGIASALSSPLDGLLKSLQQKIDECNVNKALWLNYQAKLQAKYPEKFTVEDPVITLDNRNLFIVYWNKIKAIALELMTPENEEIKATFLDMEKHIDSLKVALDAAKDDPFKQCELAIEIYDDLIDLLKNISSHIEDAKEHKEGMLRVMQYLIDTTARLSMGIILPEINLSQLDAKMERDLERELSEQEAMNKINDWVEGMSVKSKYDHYEGVGRLFDETAKSTPEKKTYFQAAFAGNR